MNEPQFKDLMKQYDGLILRAIVLGDISYAHALQNDKSLILAQYQSLQQQAGINYPTQIFESAFGTELHPRPIKKLMNMLKKIL